MVLLVGWSFFFDTLLPQLGQNDSQQQQLVSADIIYGIVLIVAGTYQFSLLKSSCLIMVALGWMNFFWMGLFASIIFAEKIWTRGGLWIGRIAGIGFIILGILSSTGAISLPSDSMSGGSSSSGDSDMMMSMDMSSSSPDID